MIKMMYEQHYSKEVSFQPWLVGIYFPAGCVCSLDNNISQSTPQWHVYSVGYDIFSRCRHFLGGGQRRDIDRSN